MLSRDDAIKEGVRQEMALQNAQTDEEFIKASVDIFFAPPEVGLPYLRAILGDEYFERHFIKKSNESKPSSSK